MAFCSMIHIKTIPVDTIGNRLAFINKCLYKHSPHARAGILWWIDGGMINLIIVYNTAIMPFIFYLLLQDWITHAVIHNIYGFVDKR